MSTAQNNKPGLIFLYALSFVILVALIGAVAYLTVRYGKLSDQLFYIILVVTGLLSSIVLSKILKTSSSIATNIKGLDIKISGAGAIACIIVLMGYKFVHQEEPLSIIVNLSSDSGRTVPVTSGTIDLETKPNWITEKISEKGQCKLIGIPPDYKSQLVYFRINAEGYFPMRDSATLSETTTQVYATLKKIPVNTLLRGHVFYNGNPGDPVRGAILFINTDSAGITDSKGSFHIEVPFKSDTEVQLDVELNGVQIHSRQLIISPTDILAVSVSK